MRPWEQNLPIGSLVLMVISGYFVCQTVDASGSGALLRARLVRMMPAFAVATLFTWTVLNLFGPAAWHTGPADLLATALIVPTTLSPHWTLVDPAYWTMVLQLFVFTVVALVGSIWKPRGAWLHAVLWAVVLVPASIKLWWLTQPHPHLLDVIFGEARLEKVHLFAAGAAVWLWARTKLGPAVLLVLPAAVWAQYVQNPGDPRLAPALGVFLIAMAAAAAGPDWRHPRLEPVLRPLVWLSGISYGTYLMNLGVGVALMWQLRLHGVSPGWQAVAGVISAVALGWALTRFVERPSTPLVEGTQRRPAGTRRAPATIIAGPARIARRCLISRRCPAGERGSGRRRCSCGPRAVPAAPVGRSDQRLPVQWSAVQPPPCRGGAET